MDLIGSCRKNLISLFSFDSKCLKEHPEMTGFNRISALSLIESACIKSNYMKRSEFLTLVQPLTTKLYSFAFSLLPDDLQSEQLVVDGLNAFLLKERKNILNREINLTNKKDMQLLRRAYFKGILRTMSEIGVRRAHQLSEQMKLSKPAHYEAFYALDPKIRFAVKLRYEGQFNVVEIEDIMQVPRYEVIERLHNGRFLMISNLNAGVEA